jgi:hypothetical protein
LNLEILKIFSALFFVPVFHLPSTSAIFGCFGVGALSSAARRKMGHYTIHVIAKYYELMDIYCEFCAVYMTLSDMIE